MNEYDCMRNYISIVEHESLSKAAKAQQVPISMLSKQLAWLEQRFNTRLIERTTRRFKVTEAGYVCYERAKILVDYVSGTKQSLLDANQEAVGEVFISAPIELNHHGFVECLVQLNQLYPKLTIKLSSDNFPYGVSDNRVDLAISTIDVNDKTIQKVPLVAFPRKIYAAPSYLEKHGTPESIHDLPRHNCLINTTYGEKNLWQFDDGSEVYVTGNFYCDNSEDILVAALGGVGLANYTEIAAAKYVGQGQLNSVELRPSLIDTTIYLYHASQVRSANVRMIKDSIAEYFAAHDLRKDAKAQG